MTFTNPQYLLDTQWLAEHLEDPSIRILDVTAMLTSKLHNRAREECYDAGHIPGALFFDVASGKGELSDPAAALPWTWPTEDHFQSVMARFGIGQDTRVVIVARTPPARFPDALTLRTRLDAAGLLDRPRVITYCGGAIAATVDAFALALFGHGSVSVYDGSLMEWAANPDLPMVDPSA